jgi:signal transduction histidine kinase
MRDPHTGLTPGHEVGQRWVRVMHRNLENIPHAVYVAEGPPWAIVAEWGTLVDRPELDFRAVPQHPYRIRTPAAIHTVTEGAPGILVGLALPPDRAGLLVEPLTRLGAETFRLLWGQLQQSLISQALAHEIRNPLTLVAGYGELLELRGDSEASRAILGEVARIHTRIEEFLEAGRPLNQEALDLADVVNSIAEHYRVVAERQGVQVQAELKRALIWGDVRYLETVVATLVRNALESMPDGGVLRLTTESSGTGGEVIVADTGPGVAREVQDNLFRPYFTTKPGGHGLGLALAWDVVARHGGRLELWPSDYGAAFRLWIPRDPIVSGGRG